jgi:hypothetical protein
VLCDADPDLTYHPDADPDSDFFYADPDPTFRLNANPDSDPSLQIKAQTLEKVLKYSHISYILVCNLQINADPYSGMGKKSGSDPDPG